MVACIAGRGFGVRREDMKKLLLATRGKVFTLPNVQQLVEHTRLREFQFHETAVAAGTSSSIMRPFALSTTEISYPLCKFIQNAGPVPR